MASVDAASSRAGASSGGKVGLTPHLDALRILASAGIVVLHYANYIEDIPFGRWLAVHTAHFNLLVDLFFVISGFVIASQYAGRVADRGAIGRFLWRRFARIYPLHIATLAFYVLIAALLVAGVVHVDNPARYPLSDLPAQVLLLQAIIGQRLTFNFPSWSLSAEMVCYLLFPLIAFIGLRRPALVALFSAVAATVLTLYCFIVGSALWPDWINQGGASRAIPAFLLGAALYLLRDRVAATSIGFLLLPSFVIYTVFGSALPSLLSLALVYLIAAAAIQYDLAGTRSLLSRLGVGRWAHLTYSSYMLHMPVATVVITLAGRFLAPHSVTSRLALIVGAMVVLAFVSAASYRLFENPIRRRLNAAFDQRRSPEEPLTVLADPQGGVR